MLSSPWDGASKPYTHRDRSNVDGPTWAAIEDAEKLAGRKVVVTQGKSTSVSASAGTHDGYGVVDIRARDLNATQVHAVLLALRKVGFAAWHRTRSQGFTAEHIHAILLEHPDLSSAARRQVTDYRHRKNGLARHGADDGPPGYYGWSWPAYWQPHYGARTNLTHPKVPVQLAAIKTGLRQHVTGQYLVSCLRVMAWAGPNGMKIVPATTVAAYAARRDPALLAYTIRAIQHRYGLPYPKAWNPKLVTVDLATLMKMEPYGYEVGR